MLGPMSDTRALILTIIGTGLAGLTIVVTVLSMLIAGAASTPASMTCATTCGAWTAGCAPSTTGCVASKSVSQRSNSVSRPSSAPSCPPHPLTSGSSAHSGCREGGRRGTLAMRESSAHRPHGDWPSHHPFETVDAGVAWEGGSGATGRNGSRGLLRRYGGALRDWWPSPAGRVRHGCGRAAMHYNPPERTAGRSRPPPGGSGPDTRPGQRPAPLRRNAE